MITPSSVKLDGRICERYSANYDLFCPLMDLIRIGRQANIAYISVHAAPDLYSSFLYIILFVLIPLDEVILALSVCLAMCVIS